MDWIFRVLFRDLKPENILIDNAGYPIIIDFGFAKKLTDKTYTLCGTPLYLPPEVILNRGHNWSADHWSLGVLIYEMLFGDTPFYNDGMQQMDLFRAIVKGKFSIPECNNEKEAVSANVISIIKGFLTKDPAQRLGSLAGGEDDVLQHKWFSSPIDIYGNNDVIDFNILREKKIVAPVVPKIRNPLDASNFEDWRHLDDKTKTRFPKLDSQQEKVFADF
jgi:serine/threonine protein kinase